MPIKDTLKAEFGRKRITEQICLAGFSDYLQKLSSSEFYIFLNKPGCKRSHHTSVKVDFLGFIEQISSEAKLKKSGTSHISIKLNMRI